MRRTGLVERPGLITGRVSFAPSPECLEGFREAGLLFHPMQEWLGKVTFKEAKPSVLPPAQDF